MSYRGRFAYTPGTSVGVSIERVSDELNYDHGDGTFKLTPGTLVQAINPDSLRAGGFKFKIASTPQASFPDGPYVTWYHDMGNGNAVIGFQTNAMSAGDDLESSGSGSVQGDIPLAHGIIEASPAPTTKQFTATFTDAGTESTFVGQVCRVISSTTLQASENVVTNSTIVGDKRVLSFRSSWDVAPAAGDEVVI